MILFCISPSKYVSFLFSNVENSKNKIFVYEFVIISTILLFWACVFGIVKSISIIMINTYYKFNIFRSLEWFNVYLIIRMKYNMFKKINLSNQKAMQDIKLIKYMNSKNLILHGSASINFAYSDYWRLSNDYDFASKSLAPQYAKPNEADNLKLLFDDFVASKYEYKNINVEVLYGKYIPARFLRKKT
ncbi:MAG4530 family protein [Mycoplasmopsis primatum]|uniref:MAG4530 family protein n=1 Tax=Mycoplasmopsis primatum TaxID=55604 RepID=UPI0038CDB383